MIQPGPCRNIETIQAPAADDPTRREYEGYFQTNGHRLTQPRGEQQNANGAEDKADYKDDDRVERPRLGGPEHL